MRAQLIRMAALAGLAGVLALPALAQTSAPAGGAAQPAPAAGKDADPVVARVDGAEVHKSDVMRTIQGLPQQIRQMPVEMIFPAVVDQIINGKLVAKQAFAEKLQDDPEVKDRLKQAEERIVEEIYLTREIDKNITPDRLKQAYAEYLQKNPPQDEVKASHILVNDEAAAKAIIAKLDSGADFAALAKQSSTDKGSATNGGDLGYFTKDQMVPAFSEAAFALEKGKYTEAPVKTQFGWHVIKVEDRRKAEPPTQDEVADQLKSDVSRQIIGDLVEKLRADATIERFQMDGSPLSAGSNNAQPDQAQPDQSKPDQPKP